MNMRDEFEKLPQGTTTRIVQFNGTFEAHDIVCVPPEDVPDYAKRVFYIPVSGVSGIGMTPDAALRSYCAEHDHERSVDELVRVNAIMAEPLVSDDN